MTRNMTAADDDRRIDIDPEQTNVVPLDRDVIDLLARRRRETGSRPAYWTASLDADRVGVAGEAAVVTVHEAADGSLFGILVGFARAERAIRPANLTESKGGGVHYELATDALGPCPDPEAVTAVEESHPDHPAAHREGVPPGTAPQSPEVVR